VFDPKAALRHRQAVVVAEVEGQTLGKEIGPGTGRRQLALMVDVNVWSIAKPELPQRPRRAPSSTQSPSFTATLPR
jgi:hypothetical protein